MTSSLAGVSPGGHVGRHRIPPAGRSPGRALQPPALVASVVLAAAGLSAGTLIVAAGDAQSAGGRTQPSVVTPVTGPSWLNHLGVKYRDTSLGRGSGAYGPPATQTATEPHSTTLPLDKPLVVTGADLYRWNCQACHTAKGSGAPPEIKPILPAVQGSSLELVRRHLQQQGKKHGGSTARAEANAARADLYRRIHNGGQRMPPREYLEQADIDVLYTYLTELARVPDAPKPSQRTVSWMRVGENVVKGTCHICHDAVGPRPSGGAMLQGAIPSLATLRSDKLVMEFVNKARSGAPVVMGDAPLHYRGRMPVFYYLKDEEVAAAYLFLNEYPPQAEAASRR